MQHLIVPNTLTLRQLFRQVSCILSLQKLIDFSAKTKRHEFMESLGLKYGFHHVDRNDIYKSVMELYENSKDIILNEYPFRIHFNDEEGVDIGGVCRDMYSAFFEQMYLKHFDGSS